jgi:cyclic-di-AMP phosphodiesterase PgpH
MGEFLDRSRFVAALIFIATVSAIVVVSSVGLSTLHAPLLVNQVATTRVTALVPFSYQSAEKTRAAREQLLDRVPPVYRLDQEPLRRFEAAARMLLNQLAALEATSPGNTQALLSRRADLNRIADTFNSHGPTYHATPEDIGAILMVGDGKTRAELFDVGLATLRDIYAQGVTDSTLGRFSGSGSIVFQMLRPDGEIAQRAAQSMEEALTFLRVSLTTDNVPRQDSQSVFRLFRFGVTPNVVFDRAATLARQEAAAKALEPVTVNVSQGQTIVDAGARITPEQHEMLVAHRQSARDHAGGVRESLTLFGRVLLVLAMVLASLIYIRIEDPETLRSNVRCGLLALVVIVNLALVRANYSLGGAEFFVRDGSWASTLPYIAPTAFAPLIVAILIDAGSGIFMALLISIFTGVIYGNRLDLLVLTFLASLVAIYFGRDVRRRGRLVRAAGAGGLTVAAFAALIGIANQTPFDTLWRQMAAGIGTGLITGIGVVGLLPILESLFKRTTDITLLELTDYNHPLLLRMQLEAPGTYHHSLVVAQLSENAANAIGANPLVARVAALFHDVGKTASAQYFGENHRDGTNPHEDLPPAESARLIKQHVPDGVELAHKHHLPRAVIDAIQQHHGTTLVRYFYHRAVEASRTPFPIVPRKRGSAADPLPPPAASFPPAPDEQQFRYDGPKPQTKESAIISLADGVEATTRSLRQVRAEDLKETIDRIVTERIGDGQLDEAPLTLEEITRIKNSFQFTMLNMLHSRVAYPSTDKPAVQANA